MMRVFNFIPVFAAVVLMMVVMAGGAAPALAACTSPAGATGAIVYNQSAKTFQYCQSTAWVAMNPQPGTGTGGCTSPTAAEGRMIYNADARVLQGCAGNVYRAMGPVGGGHKWKQVSPGNNHSCGVKKNGTLWCWGGDSNGQLGNGAITGDQVTMQQESTAATNWSNVSAGGVHTCALKSTGTLWCWGSDGSGQLGNGATTGSQISPVQESTAATDWVSVSAGGNHTCALKSTGTMWCWGNDTAGQIGNGATTGNQISPVQESTAATDWVSVSAGGTHSCGTKTNSTLWCWGSDGSSQLGNGATTSNQDNPVQESTAATNWANVSAGSNHTCALKSTGTLWCWGTDFTGQLGNGAPTGNQDNPVQESTAATNWSSVSAGGSHTCALKTNSTAWCWGDDSSGQIGNGATTGNQANPVQETTAATDWVSVNVGIGHSCAIKINGDLSCWGNDTNGQLGNGATTGDQINPVQESTLANDWGTVSARSVHSCAVKTTGTLWCWGNDTNGQLGNGAITGDQISPIQESTAATNWSKVSTGNLHTCALKNTGTLWCWGADGNGQIGNGVTSVDQISPAQESTAASNWSNISVSSLHSCAVKTTGTLWCWGSDANGQLGNGATTGNQASPVQESTSASDWVSVSAGNNHTCALKNSGALWCWGSDTAGQLGNGATTGNQVSPVQESTSASDWASVSAGNNHTCALKNSGTLWCWGFDANGQLGNGATSGDQISPVQESTTASDWSSVSAGANHTCAYKSNGTLWCWGGDGNGHLGNGITTGDQISPVQITFTDKWTNISAGANLTCGITSGKVLCWGANNNGQVGAGIALSNRPIASNICSTIGDQDRGVGTIFFNSTNNVLQYCDGVGWVKVGK